MRKVRKSEMMRKWNLCIFLHIEFGCAWDDEHPYLTTKTPVLLIFLFPFHMMHVWLQNQMKWVGERRKEERERGKNYKWVKIKKIFFNMLVQFVLIHNNNYLYIMLLFAFFYFKCVSTCTSDFCWNYRRSGLEIPVKSVYLCFF